MSQPSNQIDHHGVKISGNFVADIARPDDGSKDLRDFIEYGLSTDEVHERLKKWGPNKIQTKNRQDSYFLLMCRQFQSSVVALLLAAAAISYLFSEHLQAMAILAAVLINAVIGFLTELRTHISLKTLTDLSSPTVRVRRDGFETQLATDQLVPGDVISLEAGIRVPADVRLLQTCGINVDESALTGESVPVFKTSTDSNGESDDTVYQGTLVLNGQAWATVIATALNSKLGKLGKLLTDVPLRRTPLELELEELGKQLCWIMLVLCVVLLLVGLWHHEPMMEMIQTSIALAVAAIPEGLPVVATLALALGTHRMIKRQVLVRQLAAVETLGCCQIICTDKTGTLTENCMQVTEIFANEKTFELSGEGYSPIGIISHDQKEVDLQREGAVSHLLVTSALCNDALLENHDGQDDWHIHGDPTEGALIVAAAKAGLNHTELTDTYPRLYELPFDLSRKRMTTVHQTPDGKLIACIKGAPESILKLCKYIYQDEVIRELNSHDLDLLVNANIKMASRGLRVLAIARKDLAKSDRVLDSRQIESNLTLLGLIGMQDRPKPGVKEAIASCQAAGIKILMLTGDQAQTAKAIAQDLGIISDSSNNDAVITGKQLSELDGQTVKSLLPNASVLARVSPEAKLAIVESLQDNGYVVAMTGDGINDAPALRQADIGLAMGKAGADLARESAKIIITDDNFTSIVKAIEQGRAIYNNIQNAIAYLLTASLAAVMTVAVSVLFDTGLALLPLQLLWLNLIMHVFPALGISLLPSDKAIMKRKPRKSESSILGTHEYGHILIRALLVSVSVLLAVLLNAHFGASYKMTTISFATLSFALLFQAWSWAWSGTAISWRKLARKMRPALLINMFISYVLMFLAVYLPPLQFVLKLTPLDLTDWIVVGSASALSFILSCCVDRMLRKVTPLIALLTNS